MDEMEDVEREEWEAQAEGYNIFNFRRKYLPTGEVRCHTPPRLPKELVQGIRLGAAKLFKVGLFYLRVGLDF